MKSDQPHVSWDLSARIYGEIAPQISFYRETAARVVSAASLQSNMDVADLACGSSGIVEELIWHTHPDIRKIYCVDSSLEMLNELDRKYGSKLSLIHAHVEQVWRFLPPVDRALCNAAIWNFDLPEAFSGIRRVFKPGGIFAFTISEWDLDYWGPLTHPKYALVDAELHKRGLPPKANRGSFRKLSVRNLTREIENASLRVINMEECEVETKPEDYLLFYQIPSIVQKSLPEVPVDVAAEVFAAAMSKLPRSGLPPLRWMVFKVQRV